MVLAALEVGCSQSSNGLVLNILIANAVRYGTAKAEWFLNVVSLADTSKRNIVLIELLDCCPS